MLTKKAGINTSLLFYIIGIKISHTVLIEQKINNSNKLTISCFVLQ